MRSALSILTVTLVAASLANAADKSRFVDSVLASLEDAPPCWSTVRVQNLGDRPATVQIQAHRSSGALVPLQGLAQMSVTLAAGETKEYRLEIPEEEADANGWVRIREQIPSPELTPVVAVSALSECAVSEHLFSTPRTVAFPARNPWFSREVDATPGNRISMINLSERPAVAHLCYSSGNLYSVPDAPGAPPSSEELKPICSVAFDVQVPPFGTRKFAVQHEGTSYFSMKTQGESIILQMLRPVRTGVRAFAVDSTIHFDGDNATK